MLEPLTEQDVRGIGRNFDVAGEFLDATPFGSGHVNDTYLARYRNGAGLNEYVHQRINDNVFRDPPALMENMVRVLTHLRAAAARGPLPTERWQVLSLCPACGDAPFCRDEHGHCWRTTHRVARARSFDVVESEGIAWQAARAFGVFHRQLSDLPAPRLHDTIPDFHHTPRRMAALERAVDGDAAGRAAGAAPEIRFAVERKAWVSRLVDLAAAGELPERVTHNDTKINNILFDETKEEAICVIDLDTVMPGLSLYDFGDMVRTVTSPAAEDDPDPSHVEFRPSYFEALVDGYRAAADGMLAPRERELLLFAGKLITLEIGLRFLTDYLQGDVYFRVSRPDHNLHRCRTQFELVRQIEAWEPVYARSAAAR